MPETAADGRSRKTPRTKKLKKGRSIWIDKDMPLTRSKDHSGASGRSAAGERHVQEHIDLQATSFFDFHMCFLSKLLP